MIEPCPKSGVPNLGARGPWSNISYRALIDSSGNLCSDKRPVQALVLAE